MKLVRHRKVEPLVAARLKNPRFGKRLAIVWPSAASCALAMAPVMGCVTAMTAQPATAQNTISQPVVQPLPPAGVSDLNTALRRLARNSRDVDALIDAGNASLKVNDVDAAIGFFGRAEELAPGNPRIKIGLAAAYTRKQRPLEALRLFDEAERAGASMPTLAADRGLAYDLVGDNASAIAQYQDALSREDSPSIRQRLALSHAIAGNREAFEATLAPLIADQNAGSYRTRAFGLAILGEDAQAVAIAEAAMPRNLSSRIAPYLRYMPRLTRAQQAAAANLGIFPRAAQIGRDNPQIAQYAGSSASRNADARLAPQGQPLGRQEDTTSQRRRPDRGSSTVTAAAAPAEVQAKPAEEVVTRVARANRRAASDPLARSQPAARTRVARREVVKPEEQSAAVASSPVADNVSQPAIAATTPPASAVATPEVRGPGFDLAQVGTTPVGNARTATPVAVRVVEQPVVQAKPESVADAFANFTLQPKTGVPVDNGGVDIRTIKPPREVAEETEAKPEPPKHPKRYWVQVATGRDRSALRFDWRRISRKASDELGDKSGFVTSWGQSNRLLAGPYSNLRAAQRAVTALKQDGVDSFTFTSPEGQEIDPI